ncbi:MACPF domain-containing protein CAD1 [Tanacetum coccineum]
MEVVARLLGVVVDLGIHKHVTRGCPWVLLGDFNVALNLEDTYSGSSSLNSAMIEFKDCVADIEVVAAHWNSNVHAHSMFQVTTKLKALKRPLRKLVHDQGNLHDRVNKLRHELDVVQKSLDLRPDDQILREEEAVYVQAFNEAKLDEERFLKQKAKIEWLNVGDSNSAYFHKSLKSRIQRSRIEVVLGTDNIELSGPNVPDAFVHHYEMFLGTQMTCDELNCDGIFTKGWDIVGHDVCKAIRDFFVNGQLLKELNHTFIALIPKKGLYRVTYLGVPLISTCLFNRDCKVLVEKAQNRIGDWKNKSLSYAGRLQLCKSVISSMHVYWASVLMIPIGILLDIEQLIRGFLWCNGELKHGKAKVAGADICLPKSEGGLGLRSLEIFNAALMTTHIWNIVSNKELLWHIGSGRDVSIWFDWWSDECPLIRYLSPRDISRDGFTLQDIIADMVSNEGWRWPQAWLLKAPILGLITTPVLEVNKLDTCWWRDNNGHMSKFSVKAAWEAFRPRGNEVTWHRIVWFSNNIPRHAFHLWLVMRKSLKTHDKLRQLDGNLLIIMTNLPPPDHVADLPEDEPVNPKPGPIILYHAPAQPEGYVGDDDMEEDEEEDPDEDPEEEPIE